MCINNVSRPTFKFNIKRDEDVQANSDDPRYHHVSRYCTPARLVSWLLARKLINDTAAVASLHSLEII